MRSIGTVAAAILLSACGALLPITDAVTVRVRNDLDRQVTLVISDPSNGPNQAIPIAAPITIGPLEERDVRFAAPTETWELSMRGVDGFFTSSDLRDWSRQVRDGEISEFRLVIQSNGQMAAEMSD